MSCNPLSPWERRNAAKPSGLAATDGWFKVCTAGGANSPQLAAFSAAAAAPAAGSAGAETRALIPAAGEPGTPSAAAPNGSATAAAAPGCSEYCAKLAEGLYRVCYHALELLVKTAPAVDPAEVSGGQGLGPMWPSVKALTAVMVRGMQGQRGSLRLLLYWLPFKRKG